MVALKAPFKLCTVCGGWSWDFRSLDACSVCLESFQRFFPGLVDKLRFEMKIREHFLKYPNMNWVWIE